MYLKEKDFAYLDQLVQNVKLQKMNPVNVRKLNKMLQKPIKKNENAYFLKSLIPDPFLVLALELLKEMIMMKETSKLVLLIQILSKICYVKYLMFFCMIILS